MLDASLPESFAHGRKKKTEKETENEQRKKRTKAHDFAVLHLFFRSQIWLCGWVLQQNFVG